MKKKKIVWVSSVLSIFLLAIVSILTTFGVWDGMIPSAKFRIEIIDGHGKPVKGATVSVFEKYGFMRLKKRISYNFPIKEFTKKSQPISDADGTIKISHISEGLEIGGGAFALFWFIPVSFGEPSFIVQIETPDHRKRLIDYSNLYNKCDEEPSILSRNNPVNCQFEVVM